MGRKFRNYLVTGGYGFIGSNYIIKKIADNKTTITNIDAGLSGSNAKNLENIKASNYKYFKLDIAKHSLEEILIDRDIDVIVHFAAESHVDRSITSPRDFIDSNIIGTFNLLEASRKLASSKKKNIHFHHVSTDEVYGSLNLTEEGFTEKNQYQPNSPYSATKAASDFLARSWFHTFEINVTTSNCSNNYGPRQHPEKLIPKVISNALLQKDIPIYGTGENIRDWLYVDDHCDAIDEIIKHGEIGETYNVGGKNEITNLDIVNTILTYLDEKIDLQKKSPLSDMKFEIDSFFELIKYVDDRPGHDFRYSINPQKIEEQLNWRPKENFETGIKKTINWYLQNCNWLKSSL